MKIQLFITSIVFISFLTGCACKEKTAAELLKDPVKAEEIYSAIMSDNTHLSEFMDKMLSDSSCQSKLAMNVTLLRMACMSEKMDSLMSKDAKMKESISTIMIRNMAADSVLCDHTCTRMMETPNIKNYLTKKRNAVPSTE